MQKAYHEQLLQMTNQQVIAIRQAEINYYVAFYSTFGVQAAALGGFAYGSLTQIVFPQSLGGSTLPYGNAIYIILQDFFFVSVAACMGAAMHCIVTTIFLQVMGPGLALYGPVGSMGKAANAMREEMDQVFVAFLVMVAAFALSNFFAFWLLMDMPSAIFSSLLFLTGGFYMWHTCLQIYNKLYLDFSQSKLTDEDEKLEGDPSLGPNECLVAAAYAKKTRAVPHKNGILTFLRGKSKATVAAETESDPTAAPGDNSGATSDPRSPLGLGTGTGVASSSIDPAARYEFMHEGFMTLLEAKGKFNRWFCSLNRSGGFFMYKSKSDCPSNPVNLRPVDVALYSVTCSADDSGSSPPVYMIVLAVKDEEDAARSWHFCCDTEDELEQWRDALMTFST